MLDNAPVIRHVHDGLTIEGYSRAAVQTYWRIPELKLGFDLGAHPWDFMGTPNWMITHTHLDHIAALPVYLARRRMMKMEPPNVYLPDTAVDSVGMMLDGFTRLDRGRLPCNFIGVSPGDEIELSRELVLTVGKTDHTIPSVCYIVWDRRFKLKEEYHGLSGDEIRDLRESGTEVTREVRLPLVAYTGDTAPRGLDQNPDLYKAKILITEMTFAAPDHRQDLIHRNGHMHLDDFVKRADRFENELVICGHFSTRYGPRQAERLVRAQLPGMLDGRLKLWL
ncbi:MAG: MBL fold metallo-hydrolase [Pirellulaceae bacterium]